MFVTVFLGEAGSKNQKGRKGDDVKTNTCMGWSLISAESEVLSLPVCLQQVVLWDAKSIVRQQKDSKEENKKRNEKRKRGSGIAMSPEPYRH